MSIDEIIFVILAYTVLQNVVGMIFAYVCERRNRNRNRNTDNNDNTGIKILIQTDGRCVCCGEIIPEGTQYCYTCGKKAEKGEF